MNLFKKSDDEKIKAIIPDNFGWLEKKLSDKEMEYLWKCVDNRKGSKKSVLAGQIHESNDLVDKGDWFWQHTLYPLCVEYYQEFGNLASVGSLFAFNLHNTLDSGQKGVICSFGAGYSVCSIIVENCLEASHTCYHQASIEVPLLFCCSQIVVFTEKGSSSSY